MTTEEKLQHFLETCMEDARARSNKMLDEYKAALKTTFEEHQADARRRADMRLELESDKIERDINKRLSIEQINLRRQLGQLQDELKDKLFNELKDKLELFMGTGEYQTLLEHQIEKAIAFAGSDELIIWIDPADEDKMIHLAIQYSTAQLKVSEYSFGGGTRAVIPSRHILIDNSFRSKLNEAKEAFHFELDPAHALCGKAANIGGVIHG